MATFDAQLWSNLLNCTGGALEVPKIKYSIVSFKFKKSGEPVFVLPTEDQRIEVDANDGEGKQEMVSLDPTKARKTLGCYKEPTGNNKEALNVISKNAINKAQKVYNSSLDSKCTFRCY